MIFRWDPSKAGSNLRKHGVSFHEAATVLHDPLSTMFPDKDHSRREARYLTIGRSSKRRLLVVSHTQVGKTIRMSSARQAIRRERRFYEEGP